jgi:succinyl-CoA synthetase alpha subunit
LSILVDENKRVIVQGITGREGMARTILMKEYGTKVVAGVTPGKKGESIHGVPVYDSVEQLWDNVGPIDISVIFVPAPLVKNAALEALAAGVKLLVLIPDRVPLYDSMEIAAYARDYGARFIGPNTLGVMSPGKAVLGMIGGRASSAREWFKPGSVGVISRSGGMTSATSYFLTQVGLGQSTVVHVGGDAVIGMRQADILREFANDDQTEVVVLFGEIGTTQEEELARILMEENIKKPIIAFIGGKAAKKGTQFSHAGAIVEGKFGSYESKTEALEDAGCIVVETFEDIFTETKKVLLNNGKI